MNKIYSKVWNPKLGQLVVASELASSTGRGAVGAGHARGHMRGALALAVLLALGGLSGSAFAADAVCVDPDVPGSTVGDASAVGDQVACGQGAIAVGTNAMAIGAGAQATAVRAIALGYNSLAFAEESLAIGGATSNGDRAIAMGPGAFAGNAAGTTASMIAIGSNAFASGNASVALGSSARTGGEDGSPGNQAVAIGFNSRAAANGSVAIGEGAKALSPAGSQNLSHGPIAIGRNAEASALYAAALGFNAQATGDYSTAMGVWSAATHADAVALGHGVRAEALGSVAIGGNGGSGLFATGTRAAGMHSVAMGSLAEAGNDYSIALGYRSRVAGEFGIGLGMNNQVLGDASAALGLTNNISGHRSFAIGSLNTIDSGTEEAFVLGNEITLNAGASYAVALGSASNVTVENGVALGANSVALVAGGAAGFNPAGASASDIAVIQATNSSMYGAVSVGSGAAGGNRQIVNVAAGSNDSDAVNVAQLKAAQAAATTHYYSVNSTGGGNEDNEGATGADAIAIGKDAVASGNFSVAMGRDAHATNWNSIAIGDATVAQGARSIALGDHAEARGLHSISVGNRNVVAGDLSGAIGDINNVSGSYSFAIGSDNTIHAGTNGAFILGNRVTLNAGAGNAMALGNATSVTVVNAVALGSASVASVAGGAAGFNPLDASASDIAAIQETNSTVLGAVSVGTGEDGGNRQIVNVAAGTNNSDAVNVAQLKAVSNLATAGWNVTDANGNTANIGPGGEVRFESGNANLTVTQTGNDDEGVVQVTLGNSLDLTAAGSVTMGQTVVNNTGVSVGANVALGNSGLVIAGGPSVTTTGINAGDATITGVLAGVNGTDAVNVSQLNSTVGTALSSATWNVKDANGNTANIGPGGEVRFESGNTNLTVTQTGGDDEGVVEITLGNDLNLTAAGSVTTGQTVMNNSGVAVGANVVLGTSGLTVAGGPVTTAVTGSGLTTGTVVVSGANNSVTGLSNTTLAVPGFAAAGRAATEEQLQLVRGEIGAGIEANKTKYYSVNSTGGGNEDNDGANGTDAIAAGKDAAADGDGSVALGLGASASGDRGVALGAGAQAQSLDSLAIGSGAVAGHANSIALGAGSATTVGARASYQGAFVGNSSSTGEMNVGGRQITGVAAGSAATDAVNVSQLQAGVDHAITEAKDYTDSQMGNLNAGLSDLDNRVGAVEGDLIDIRGDITQIQGDIVDIQGDITNLDQRVSQIGDSMGDLASTVNGFDNRVTELENRGTGPVRVTQGETYEAPVVSGANSLGGGNGAVASGDNSVALGNQAVASANNSTAIGQGAVASHDNSVALGQGSATTVGAQTGYNAAYVGSSHSTGEVNVGGRTISGVAPGIAGTDAVNVNQLTAGVNHAVSQANQYTDSRLNQMQGDVWSIDRGYRGATASAMAMAGIPQAYVPGKSMLAVGFGGYQNEYGMAVGLSGITVDGRWVYKAQASGNTTRDWGFSMGAGIQW